MKKITKILSVILAAVMLMTAFCVTSSAASIEDTAKAIDSGTKATFKPDTSGMFGGSKEYKDFKVKLSEKGTLKLTISTVSEDTRVKLIDSNGNTVECSETSATTGNIYNKKEIRLSWNSNVEKFKGVIKYKSLAKGTYYVRIWNNNFSEVKGKMSVSFKYPQASTDEEETGTISALSVTLKKGDVLQLGTVIEGEGTPEWTSSKKSVATVDSEGKVTAKSAGTSEIQAKLGKSSVKIKIKVTK